MGLVYVSLCSLDTGETFLPYLLLYLLLQYFGFKCTDNLHAPARSDIAINHQQNPQVSAYPRLAVLLPVRCVRVLHSRVPPTPVSQTGEAELAAREIGVWRSH